jgi:Flp pilus assembly protein TadG
MLSQAQMLWIYFRVRAEALRGHQEGASVVETVIITAIFAALALLIGGIIVAKVTSKANSIDLN